MFFGYLDAHGRAHLRRALDLYARRLRQDGIDGLPESLNAIFSALNRPEPTQLGEDEEAPEDAAMMTPLLYDVHDVATRLRCSPRTVERLIRDGKLQSVRLGRARRIIPNDLEAYVQTLSRRGGGR